MLGSYQRFSWTKPAGYAATHCQNCAAGWTRQGKQDEVVIVCLVDREQVLADMTHCDRFLSKKEAAAQAAAKLTAALAEEQETC